MTKSANVLMIAHHFTFELVFSAAKKIVNYLGNYEARYYNILFLWVASL